MYLTYSDYVNKGGALDSTTFTILEIQAENIVDWHTFNRLKKDTVYPQELTNCMFLLVNILDKDRQATAVGQNAITGETNAAISSQSNDGVMISYNVMSAFDLRKTLESDITNTVRMTLAGCVNSLGHKLLYRGIYDGE